MKSHHKWLTGGTLAALVVLVWPGPAVHADTSLGGYTAIATAAVVHIEVFDPTIPIPSSPQMDGSVGYTKSNVDSGPTSRALSSYLWPGVVVGDGFDQLLKSPGAQYPLQADSRYPATTQAPADNTVQLTDGNGMTTSTDGFNTKSTVTLVGLAGDGSNPLGGIGSGLQQIGGQKPAPSPTKSQSPLPLDVGAPIAAVVSAKNVTSTSITTVADKTLTSEAHAAVSNLSLLGGIISIAGLDVQSKVVSDGAKATTSQTATIGQLKVLGIPIALGTNGVDLGLPALSTTVSNLLSSIGLELHVLPVTQSTTGASGQVSNRALQIVIDTKLLKQVLGNVLNPIVAALPSSIRDQLSPFLSLGPRIVLTVGTTDTNATAAPAFNFNFPSGGSVGVGGSGSTGGTGSGPITNGALPANTSGGGTQTPTQVNSQPGTAPASYALPALGSIPRLLILGLLAAAALVGWVMRMAGGPLLFGGRNCGYGLTTGVPDLRKE